MGWPSRAMEIELGWDRTGPELSVHQHHLGWDIAQAGLQWAAGPGQGGEPPGAARQAH